MYFAKIPISPAYARLTALRERGGCIVLDGGVATELERVRHDGRALGEHAPWGTWALNEAPAAVLEMHARYVAAGCDVIATNSWALLEAAVHAPDRQSAYGLPAWTDLARSSIRLARQAIKDGDRGDECAVAFAINDDIRRPGGFGAVELLTWLWNEEPPDLVLIETVTSPPDDAMCNTIEMIVEEGLPVWVSFRRCAQGPCTRMGEHDHPSTAESEAFAAGVRRLEQIGVDALLLNCVPLEHVSGAVAQLAALVDLPIGVYPNVGRPRSDTWESDPEMTPQRFVQVADGWRREGAQIIGGCCGSTPAHVQAVARHLRGLAPS